MRGGYGEILDIFGGGGIITKLDYFWVSLIYIFSLGQGTELEYFWGIGIFQIFLGL